MALPKRAPAQWSSSFRAAENCDPFHPELETNIAIGYVPWQVSGIGTSLAIELPHQYCDAAAKPVWAEVVDVPSWPSAHPSARGQARAKGTEYAE